MTLKELRQLRAQKASRGKAAVAEMNAILERGANASADETAKVAALETEIQALETEVPDLDRQIAQKEATDRRTALFAAPAGSTARTFELDPALTGGFKSLSHFASAVVGVATGQAVQLEAAASNYMQNQGSAGEGYLVPTEFSKTIWELALSDLDLLGMTNPEPTSSNSVFKPKDETTPWGASGVQAAWRSEASQMTATKLAMTGELMTLHELYAFCAASQELLADAPMLQDRLGRQAGRAIQWKSAEAIMWGTGAGQPTGFMTSPALIVQAIESGQATATIVLANLYKMLAHVLRNGGMPMWLANQDIIPQLATLTIGNVPVWIPINQGLQSSPFDGFLLGYPLKFTEHAQTLGTQGDISCVNLDGYYSAVKSGGVDFAASIHLYFDQNLTAFRWTFRMAGQPYLSKPVQPAKGSTTKSHFVTLAARP